MARLALICATLSGVLWIASWPEPLLPWDIESNTGFANVSYLGYGGSWVSLNCQSSRRILEIEFDFFLFEANMNIWGFAWEEKVRNLRLEPGGRSASPLGIFWLIVASDMLSLSLPYWLFFFGWVVCFVDTVKAIRFGLRDLFIAATVVCVALSLVRLHCTMLLALPLLLISVGTSFYIVSLALWRLARSQAPSLLFDKTSDSPVDKT